MAGWRVDSSSSVTSQFCGDGEFDRYGQNEKNCGAVHWFDDDQAIEWRNCDDREMRLTIWSMRWWGHNLFMWNESGEPKMETDWEIYVQLDFGGERSQFGNRNWLWNWIWIVNCGNGFVVDGFFYMGRQSKLISKIWAMQEEIGSHASETLWNFIGPM